MSGAKVHPTTAAVERYDDLGALIDMPENKTAGEGMVGSNGRPYKAARGTGEAPAGKRAQQYMEKEKFAGAEEDSTPHKLNRMVSGSKSSRKELQDQMTRQLNEPKKRSGNAGTAKLLISINEGKRMRKGGKWGRHFCVVNPTSRLRVVWDSILLFLLIIIASFTPYQIAFMQDQSYFNIAEWPLVFALDRIIDFYFVLDILMNFRSAWLDKEGRVLFHPATAAYRYLTGFFLIDLVSTIPWDMLELLGGSGGGSSGIARSTKMLKLLRLTKLIKVIRASRLFKRWEQKLVMKIKFGVLRMIKFFVVILIVVHWLGCIMAFVGTMSDTSTSSWVKEQGLEKASSGEVYLTSLEWSMQTLTTVGYGSVTATNSTERLYVIIGMVIGAAIFSYVVGTVCTLVTGLMVNSIEFQGRMDKLSEYMTTHNFPKELRLRANTYCFYTYEVQRTSESTQHEIRAMLSPCMRKEVAQHIYGEKLRRVTIFKTAQTPFIVDCASQLVTTTYAPMEYVFDEDEPVDTMYIICKGRVQMEDWQGDQLLANWTLQSPEVFGETFLLFKTAAYVAARTMTFCEFAMMRRDVFLVLLEQYPEMYPPLRQHTIRSLWQRMFRALLIQSPEDLEEIKRGFKQELLAKRAKEERLVKKRSTMQMRGLPVAHRQKAAASASASFPDESHSLVETLGSLGSHSLLESPPLRRGHGAKRLPPVTSTRSPQPAAHGTVLGMGSAPPRVKFGAGPALRDANASHASSPAGGAALEQLIQYVHEMRQEIGTMRGQVEAKISHMQDQIATLSAQQARSAEEKPGAPATADTPAQEGATI